MPSRRSIQWRKYKDLSDELDIPKTLTWKNTTNAIADAVVLLEKHKTEEPVYNYKLSFTIETLDKKGNEILADKKTTFFSKASLGEEGTMFYNTIKDGKSEIYPGLTLRTEKEAEIFDTAIRRYYVDGYMPNITAWSFTTERVFNPDIENTPLYKSSMVYPSIGTLESKNTSTCCWDIIEQDLNLSYEELKEYTNRNKNEGMTSKEFHKIYKDHNKALYMVDMVNNVIFENKLDHDLPGINRKPFVYLIGNGHLYQVNDESRKNILNKIKGRLVDSIQANTIKHKMKGLKEKTKSTADTFDIALTKNTEVVYVAIDNLYNTYVSLLQKNIAYSSNLTGNTITKIQTQDKTIYANNAYGHLSETATRLNIPYHNQDFPKLGRDYLETIKEAFSSTKYEWKQSVFNVSVREAFKYPNGGLNFRNEYNNNKKNRVHGIDAYRAYSSEAVKGNFMTIDIDDDFEPFQVVNYNKNTPGFYMISKESMFVNPICDYIAIRAYIELGEIKFTDITHFIKCKFNRGVDLMLKKYVNTIYQKTPKQAKLLVNYLIGTFGSSHTTSHTHSVITDNKMDAGYMCNTLKNARMETIAINLGESVSTHGKSIYHVYGVENKIKTTTDELIRISIVQRSNANTYRKMKLIEQMDTAKIIAIKTDCVIYSLDRNQKKSPTDASKKFGSFRYEKIVQKNWTAHIPCVKEITLYVKPKWNHYRAPDEYFDIAKLDMYDNCYVNGFAGSGKSHILRQYAEKLRADGKRVAIGAFTHTASQNIGGQTLHSLLGIDCESGLQFNNAMERFIALYDVLMLDEMSMLPLSVYRILCVLPVRIIGFGDWYQLPPVKEDKTHYNQTSMFISLFKNQVHLTKQCRADATFANGCREFYENMTTREDAINLLDLSDVEIKHKRINIVKTNRKRIIINDMITAKHFVPDRQGGEFKSYYNFMPIIAEKNDLKKIDIHNNSRWTIIYIDVIKDKKNNDYNSITIYGNNITKKITQAMLYKHFRPAYAMTCHKMQGATIKEDYAIHEFAYMSRESQYTALTRASDKKYIFIIK